MTYRYAYAKKYAAQIDSFRVQYSLDCGGTWNNIFGVLSLNTMANNSGGVLATNFIPTTQQWKIQNLPSSALNVLNNKSNVKIRFYFKSDPNQVGSNNIFIDQINIQSNSQTSLIELENNKLWVYPNPAKDLLYIESDLTMNNETIFIYNLLGDEVLRKETIQNAQTTLAINNLPQGVYFVKAKNRIQKFIKL
jgi:Secretion system C-terminal sorting domain